MTTMNFKITGMHCEGCARGIEKGLKTHPEVRTAQADFTGQSLQVDATVGPDSVRAWLDDMGYEAALN